MALKRLYYNAMSKLILLFKRLLVALLGLVIVWFSAFNLFPWIDDRLPLILALIATYCFLAYVGLPAVARVWHMLHKPTHVPTRSIAQDGWALDPINLVVLARSEREFVAAMKKAGWLTADKLNIKNSMRFVWAMLFNRPYPNAPFGTHYVFGRPQDLGFQIPIGNSPRKRHHVRFWRLGTTILENEHEHHGFWRSLLKKFLRKEMQVWVGAATLDWGLNIRVRNLQIDHGIDSDTNAERDFIVESLKNANVLKDSVEIKAGEPLHTRHQGFREKIIADGYVVLCELKKQFVLITKNRP